MLTLPRHPRKSERRAFWLVFSGVVTALAFGAGVIAFGALTGVVSAVAVSVALTLVGSVSAISRKIYDGWSRLASTYSQLMLGWLTRLAYGVVVVSGMAGSRLPVRDRTAGGWEVKSTTPPQAYASQSALGRSGEVFHDHWIPAIASWSIRSRNAWLLGLLPLFLMLSMVCRGSARGLSTKNYTLY
jgi:hypothetical protein